MSRRPLPKKLRFQILKRDGFACRYCGARAPGAILHVDHKEAVANGGDDHPDNLVTACESCNLGKSDDYMQLIVEDQRSLALGFEAVLDAVERFSCAPDADVIRLVNLFAQRGMGLTAAGMILGCDSWQDALEALIRLAQATNWAAC